MTTLLNWPPIVLTGSGVVSCEPRRNPAVERLPASPDEGAPAINAEHGDALLPRQVAGRWLPRHLLRQRRAEMRVLLESSSTVNHKVCAGHGATFHAHRLGCAGAPGAIAFLVGGRENEGKVSGYVRHDSDIPSTNTMKL